MYKKFLSIVIIVVMTFSGCKSSNDDNYHGEYPELYSIAIHSLLGSTGYGFSEVKFDSEISVMEEDNYGRILFLYFENNIVSTYSIIISQGNDDKYVYFYSDYNFISANKEDFSIEAIGELKQKNDWGMEIDKSKCIAVEIVRKKDEGPIATRTLMELYEKALGNDAYGLSRTEFFMTDDYGRSIYFGYGMLSSDRYIVMLFDPDGSYDENRCVMELSDLYNYQDELKQFKDLNDWNRPLS